ncbi:hypothetical protein HPB47_008053 [Ixodes persulcatus]|uniref:Uncharacterized protein n=1 Tax=Ixodes persulcatus TaxID=34615 RepID=A0AC60P5V9_IXOPE|nr:hypothetical protein HPB47_008053 [Ixodes persulcatus]
MFSSHGRRRNPDVNPRSFDVLEAESIQSRWAEKENRLAANPVREDKPKTSNPAAPRGALVRIPGGPVSGSPDAAREAASVLEAADRSTPRLVTKATWTATPLPLETALEPRAPSRRGRLGQREAAGEA